MGCVAKTSALSTVARASCVMLKDDGAMVIALEIAWVQVGEVKRRVWLPDTPVTYRLLKLAKPLALVVAVKVPPNVPGPVSMAAVTTTPATGLPSFARITG